MKNRDYLLISVFLGSFLVVTVLYLYSTKGDSASEKKDDKKEKPDPETPTVGAPKPLCPQQLLLDPSPTCQFKNPNSFASRANVVDTLDQKVFRAIDLGSWQESDGIKKRNDFFNNVVKKKMKIKELCPDPKYPYPRMSAELFMIGGGGSVTRVTPTTKWKPEDTLPSSCESSKMQKWSERLEEFRDEKHSAGEKCTLVRPSKVVKYSLVFQDYVNLGIKDNVSSDILASSKESNISHDVLFGLWKKSDESYNPRKYSAYQIKREGERTVLRGIASTDDISSELQDVEGSKIKILSPCDLTSIPKQYCMNIMINDGDYCASEGFDETKTPRVESACRFGLESTCYNVEPNGRDNSLNSSIKPKLPYGFPKGGASGLVNGTSSFLELMNVYLEDHVFANCVAPKDYTGDCDNVGNFRIASSSKARQKTYRDFLSERCQISWDNDATPANTCPKGWKFVGECDLYNAGDKEVQDTIFTKVIDYNKEERSAPPSMKTLVKGIVDKRRDVGFGASGFIRAEIVPVDSIQKGTEDYENFLLSRQLVRIEVLGEDGPVSLPAFGSTRSGLLEFLGDSYENLENLKSSLGIPTVDEWNKQEAGKAPVDQKAYPFNISIDQHGNYVWVEGEVRYVNAFLNSRTIRFVPAPGSATSARSKGYRMSTSASNKNAEFDVKRGQRSLFNNFMLTYVAPFGKYYDLNKFENTALVFAESGLSSIVNKIYLGNHTLSVGENSMVGLVDRALADVLMF